MVSISSPVDKKHQNRLEALAVFAARCQAASFPAPPDADIAGIAANPDDWRSRADPQTVAAWGRTIDELLLQVKFGTNPIAANDFLDDDLKRPAIDIAYPPKDKSSSRKAVDQGVKLIDELIRWRSQAITDGVDGADSIKDVTLKGLVKNNQTDADQIGRQLPGQAAALAGQIASLIERFKTNASEVEPVEPEPDSGPPTTMFEVVRPERDSGPQTTRFEAVRPEPDSPSTTRFEAVTPNRDLASTTPAPRHASPESPVRPAIPDTHAESPSDSMPEPPARHAQPDSALLDLSHADFCEYAYEPSDVEPGKVQFKTMPSGAMRLSFEPHTADGKMVIYRVVSGEDVPPYMPEAGDPVAVTTGMLVDDARYPSSAVRHYQVWCHLGVDREDACQTQPFLLAQGELVSPVDDLELRELEGRVTGTWTVFPGTRRVAVYRIPLSGVAPGNARIEAHNEICTDSDNLTGFVDAGPVRGERYLYRVFAEVLVGGTPKLSSPRQQPMLVSVVLQSVSDLRPEIHAGYREFDLTWTTPDAGAVRVYWFPSPPRGGLENRLMEEAALAVAGLADESKIPHPVTAGEPGTSQMRAVPWPAGWQRLYLLPVTVHNDQAQIGSVKIVNRPLPPVANARIVERFDTETVTFGWPEGAVAVKAFIGMEGVPPEEICSGPNARAFAEISETTYLRDGGLIFPEKLTEAGGTVYLMGVGYSGAAEIRGEIVAVDYPGLTRVYYDIAVSESGNDGAIVLGADNMDYEAPPALVLINNPKRFPLAPDDGRHVPLLNHGAGRAEAVATCNVDRIHRKRGSGTGAGTLTDTGWRVSLTNVTGYLRMFFLSQPPGRPVALRDPDPTPGPGRCGLYRVSTTGPVQ